MLICLFLFVLAVFCVFCLLFFSVAFYHVFKGCIIYNIASYFLCVFNYLIGTFLPSFLIVLCPSQLLVFFFLCCPPKKKIKISLGRLTIMSFFPMMFANINTIFASYSSPSINQCVCGLFVFFF